MLTKAVALDDWSMTSGDPLAAGAARTSVGAVHRLDRPSRQARPAVGCAARQALRDQPPGEIAERRM
jgi:hypothetical protein